MDNYGEVLEDGTLKFVRMLPGPVERVWSWLVEGEKRAQWLSGGGDAEYAGQTIKFEFFHQDLTPHDETPPEKYREMEAGVSYDVKVLVFEPPHRLTIYWPGNEGRANDIEFRLSEDGDKVRLELFQRGEVTAEELNSSASGWHVHLDLMADKLGGETPAPFWESHEAFFEEYKVRLKDALAKLS